MLQIPAPGQQSESDPQLVPSELHAQITLSPLPLQQFVS